MARTTTRPGTDRRPLISFLKVEADHERRMLAIYQSSARRIAIDLKKFEARNGIGAGVRLEQLALARAAIQREMATMWRAIGDEIAAGRAEAAALATESMYPVDKLRLIMPEADVKLLVDSAKASATRGIEAAEARMTISRIPLSERVYQTSYLVNGKIDSLVNNALSRGASAAELAKDVRDYIKPTTSGGVKYAAQRLARTEINNAYHATQVQEAIKAPWVDAVRWNLSGSHPTPDECNDYAEGEHIKGQDPGLWKPGDVPQKPHPNCLCFVTPEAVGREQFINSFFKGDYDAHLNDLMGEKAPVHVPGPVAPETPKTPRATKTTTAAPAEARTVAPKVTDPFPDLPKLPKGGMSYNDSLGLANTPSSREYRNNCHFVVNSMEMRARGYDVVAAPTYKDMGRYNHSIARDWLDPKTGESRPFEYAVPRKSLGETSVMEAAERVTADWPAGARGFVSGDWNSGGGHIFSVYKDEKGVLKFVDGQVGQPNASRNLARMTKVQFLRVDDLEPVADRIGVSVSAIKQSVTKDVQLVKLRQLYDQYRADQSGSGAAYSSYTHWILHLYDEMRKHGIA